MKCGIGHQPAGEPHTMMIRQIRRSGIAAILLLAAAAGCSGDATGPVDPTKLTFATFLGVDLSQMTRTGSGLYFRDEVVGAGAIVQPGDNVTVHYIGWLHTGQQFDSSYDRGTPFTVVNVGFANVIAGWNEGLIGTRVGGRRLLVIPSQLAYGAFPPPGIPMHATMVFRVETLAISQ
jgi:FKBP-type peptidyl-prolyl cis-trans isomerase FkpA